MTLERYVTYLAYEMRLVREGICAWKDVGGGQDPVWQPVRRAAGDAGADRRVARTDGSSGSANRGALGVNLGPLDSRPDDRLHGRAQQPVLSREAQGARVSVSRIHDHCALLRCRETYPTVLLTH